MEKFITSLWFDGNAEEAVQFYTSVFPDSSTNYKTYYDENHPFWKEWEIMTIEFSINGSKFLAINWWPHFKFSPAISFIISCEDQEQMNYYYDKLSFVPEAEQCWWIQDKFWVSWQIVPKNIQKYASNKNTVKEILKMKRLNIDELEKVYNS